MQITWKYQVGRGRVVTTTGVTGPCFLGTEIRTRNSTGPGILSVCVAIAPGKEHPFEGTSYLNH